MIVSLGNPRRAFLSYPVMSRPVQSCLVRSVLRRHDLFVQSCPVLTFPILSCSALVSYLVYIPFYRIISYLLTSYHLVECNISGNVSRLEPWGPLKSFLLIYCRGGFHNCFLLIFLSEVFLMHFFSAFGNLGVLLLSDFFSYILF